MTRRVESMVSATGFSLEELDDLTGQADRFNQTAGEMETLARQWATTALALRREQVDLAGRCPGQVSPMNGWEPSDAQGPARHAWLPFGQLIDACNDQALTGRTLASWLTDLALSLVTVYSTYSSAESTLERILSTLTSFASALLPVQSLAIAGGLAAGSLFLSAVTDGQEGGLDPLLHGTAGLQQPFMSGLARGMLGMTGGDPDSPHPVNELSGRASQVTSWMAGMAQGDRLTLAEVVPKEDALRPILSVDDALTDLKRVGSGVGGIGYATVAVQRYRRQDGSSAWAVIIPGTDGHADSPLGWEQNLELMGENREGRMGAASARLVRRAMEEAGIGPADPVALIGHSQGGIAAACLASDLGGYYQIEHVVTAGSPVANHPVPESTWVTSVEMEDELVSSLDGADNPDRPSWLTVRGRVDLDRDTRPGQGKEVEDSRDRAESTHGMNYQLAAWRDARSRGQPLVARHEQHLAQVVKGHLEETLFYQGRMGPRNGGT